MNNLMRAALALSVLTMAACASQSSAPVDTRTESEVSQNGPPPPAPPPPPPMTTADQSVAVTGSRNAQERGRAVGALSGGYGQPYAQLAPQPMPGDVDRDRYHHDATNPIHQVATDPVSTFSIDVDSAAYSNVRRFLTEGRMPPRDAVRTEELVNYFDYNYPLPETRQQPFSTTVAMAPSPWAHGRQLLHIGLQGYNIVPRERPPLNLVLLLDFPAQWDPKLGIHVT